MQASVTCRQAKQEMEELLSSVALERDSSRVRLADAEQRATAAELGACITKSCHICK